ncbi:MAG TPA: hypothetical protein VNM46_04345, partial [Xanthobacteraceae bacterium]|nr:hypothetical protein [Xanthobacteraceae bacterium]
SGLPHDSPSMNSRLAERPPHTQQMQMPEWPQRRRRDASHPCLFLSDEGGGRKGRRQLDYAM